MQYLYSMNQFKKIIKECVNEIAIEEGIFDRLKSRASGAVSGAKDSIKGGLHKVDHKAFKSPYDKKQGDAYSKLGSNKYNAAKLTTYKKIASKKLENVAREILSDLDKLGVPKPKGVSEKQINFLKSSLEKALDEIISKFPIK